MNPLIDPDFLSQILLFAVPVVLGITLHEAAHGYVALHFGDTTARDAGRVTLNPLKHVDPFGTIILPVLLLWSSGGSLAFGYAKPVPVKFGELRNPRWHMIWVAIAGPAMNLLLAIASVLLLRLALSLGGVLAAGGAGSEFLLNLLVRSAQLNVILAIFNMLPLPPLDGSKVVAPFLPWAIARRYLGLEHVGMLILLGLLVLVPMIAQQVGSNFDVFGPLVRLPAAYVTQALLSLVGIG